MNYCFSGKTDVRVVNEKTDSAGIFSPSHDKRGRRSIIVLMLSMLLFVVSHQAIAKQLFDPLMTDTAYLIDAPAIEQHRVVAILDSGINDENNELRGKVIARFDFVNNTTQTTDTLGHGTKVASVIAANRDGIGMSGILPASRLIDAKVVDDNQQVTNENLVKAIDFAVSEGADVINMSFTGGTYSEQLDNLIHQYSQNGIIFVAAAGNEGRAELSYPAAYPNVYSIGSKNSQTDEVANYSNYGDDVDAYIPEGIWTFDGHTYEKTLGTSEASAVFSAYVQQPKLGQQQNKLPLNMTADWRLAETASQQTVFLDDSDSQSFFNSMAQYVGAKESVKKIIPLINGHKYVSVGRYSRNVLVDIVDLARSADNTVMRDFNAQLVLFDMAHAFTQTAYATEFDENVTNVPDNYLQEIMAKMVAITNILDNVIDLVTDSASYKLQKELVRLVDLLQDNITKTKGKKDPGSKLLRKTVNGVLDVLEGQGRRKQGINRYKTVELNKSIDSYANVLRTSVNTLKVANSSIKKVTKVLGYVSSRLDLGIDEANKFNFLVVKATEYFVAIDSLNEHYEVANQTQLTKDIIKKAAQIMDENNVAAREQFFDALIAYNAIKIFGPALGDVIVPALLKRIKSIFKVAAKRYEIKVSIKGKTFKVNPYAILLESLAEGASEVAFDFYSEVIPAYMYNLYLEAAVGLKDSAIYEDNMGYITAQQIEQKIIATIIVHRFSFYTAQYVWKMATSELNNGTDLSLTHLADDWEVTLEGATFHYEARTWQDNMEDALSVSGMAGAAKHLFFVGLDLSTPDIIPKTEQGLVGFLNSVDNSNNNSVSSKLADFLLAYDQVAGTLLQYQKTLSEMASAWTFYDSVAISNDMFDQKVHSKLKVRELTQTAGPLYNLAADEYQLKTYEKLFDHEYQTGVQVVYAEMLRQSSEYISRKDFFLMAVKLGLKADFDVDFNANPYAEKEFLAALLNNSSNDELKAKHSQIRDYFHDIDDHSLTFNEKIWLLYGKYRGVINGYNGTELRPDENITRAQAFAIAARILLSSLGVEADSYDFSADSQQGLLLEQRLNALGLSESERLEIENSSFKNAIKILIVEGIVNGECANGKRDLNLDGNLTNYQGTVVATRIKEAVNTSGNITAGDKVDSCTTTQTIAAKQAPTINTLALAGIPIVEGGTTETLTLKTQISEQAASGHYIFWEPTVGSASEFSRVFVDGKLHSKIAFKAPSVIEPIVIPIDVYSVKYSGQSQKKTFYVQVVPPGHSTDSGSDGNTGSGIQISATYDNQTELFKVNFQANEPLSEVQLQASYDGQNWQVAKTLNTQDRTSGHLKTAVESANEHELIYLRLGVKQASGQYGDWSAVFSLAYQGAASGEYVEKGTELPLRPSLADPGRIVLKNTINLLWQRINDSKNDDNVSYYEVEYADNSSFAGATRVNAGNNQTNPDNFYTAVTYSVTGLDNLTRYYFKVRAVNLLGVSRWSNIESIRVEVNELPYFDADDFAPADGVVLSNKAPQFRWEGEDANRDELQYRLLLGKSVDDMSKVMGFSDASIDKESYDWLAEGEALLRPGQQYYWRVELKESGKGLADYGGSYISSPVMTFTTPSTGPDLAITEAVLVSELTPGNKAKFNVTVKNVGNESAGKANYEVFYKKATGISEFRSGSNKVTGQLLAPGESEVLAVEVTFQTDPVTSGSTVYDNVLVVGNSSVIFELSPSDQDMVDENNTFELAINYEDQGRPVFDYFYIGNISWYEEHNKWLNGRLGTTFNNALCFKARDDLAITKATVEVQVHSDSPWLLLKSFTNSDDVISECTDWSIPNDPAYISNDVRFRARVYDGNTTYAEMTSYEVPVFSNNLQVSVAKLTRESETVGSKLFLTFETDHDYPIEVIEVVLKGSRSADLWYENGSNVSLDSTLTLTLPDNDLYAMDDAYLEIFVGDAVSNIILFESARFDIKSDTTSPKPFDQAVAIYPELPALSGAYLEHIELDDAGVAHMVFMEELKNSSNSVLSWKHYYRSYNSATGQLSPLTLILNQPYSNSGRAEHIVGLYIKDNKVHLLKTNNTNHLYWGVMALGSSQFTFSSVAQPVRGGLGQVGFFDNQNGQLNIYYLTDPGTHYADKRFTFKTVNGGSLGSAQLFEDSYYGPNARIDGNHIQSLGRGDIRMLDANGFVSEQWSFDDDNIIEYGEFTSTNPDYIDFYQKGNAYYLLKRDQSEVALAVNPMNAIDYKHKAVAVVNDKVIFNYVGKNATNRDISFISVYDLNTQKTNHWDLGEAKWTDRFATNVDTNSTGDMVVGTLTRGSKREPYIAIGNVVKQASFADIYFTQPLLEVETGSTGQLSWALSNINDLATIDSITLYEEHNGQVNTLATFTELPVTTFDYTPTGNTGNRVIRIEVLGSDGLALQDTIGINIVPVVALTEFDLNTSIISLGDKVTFSWQASGASSTTAYSIYRQDVLQAGEWVKMVTVIGINSKTLVVSDFVGEHRFKITTAQSELVAATPLIVNGDLFVFDDSAFGPTQTYIKNGDYVKLRWQAKSGSSSDVLYNVYAKVGDSDVYSQIAITTSSTASLRVESTESFSWYVEAFADQYFATSPVFNVSTASDTRPVVTGSTLQSHPDTGVNVLLQLNSPIAVESFNLYRSHLGSEQFIGISNTTDFTDADVLVDTTYTYRATSTIDGVETDFGESLEVVIPEDERFEVAIETQIDTLVAVDGFDISYAPGHAVSFEQYDVLLGVSPSELTSYQLTGERSVNISGLDFGSTYYIEIWGIGVSGQRVSSQPAKLSFTTEFNTQKLVANTTLSVATLSTQSVGLSWTAVDGATGYSLCRSDNQADYSCLYDTLEDEIVDRAGIEPLTTYYYKLKSYNSASQVWSEALTVTTPCVLNGDHDSDGVIGCLDDDDDNDGVPDVDDAFPFDASESVDTDGDGTGNNADTDDDGDGVADATDAFPLNASESVDTDSDGTGNNADTDDDGDGVADTADAFPLNAAESVDTDGDGTGNNADTDDDGDGVADTADAFPLNAAESVDTDGDGIGNNADTDDDGDGVVDSADAFPLNPAESVDTDGDGTGNNADSDDDGDGVVDSADAFPLNPAESVDTDGDGIGNNADTDDDGDGIEDTLDTEPLNDKRWTDVDTDGDGFTDDIETLLGLDINNPQDVWADTDGDRLPLVLELLEATSPTVKDNNVFGNHRLLVQQAYIDIKGEFASDADITFWVDRLTLGTSLPADVYTSLLEEADMAHYGFIGRVYQAIMRRDADIGGALAHLKGLKNGVKKQAVVDTFVQSTEFVSRYGDLSNSDFVNLVYQNVMGREADEGGFANWLGLLEKGEDSDGISRAGMMLGFIDSTEYINSQDSTQRVGVLSLLLTGQPLSTGNKTSYKQLLTGEGGINGVVSAILASNGYRQSLMASISAANDDTDGDGIPDGVEFIGGTDISVKDNDITANDRLFVKQMLRDMTGEPWSYQAVTAQVTALTHAGTRAAWVKQLLDMEQVKNQRQAISRLYFAFFLRGADYGGLMTWIGHYEAGMSLTVMAGHFAASTEFVDRYGSLSTDEFVNLVYHNVLGRAADPGGFAVWQDHLDSGRLTRGDMMVGFSESIENSGNTVHRGRVVLLFNLLYGRAANDSEFTTWRDRLGNGTDVGDLIDDITNSSEYLARFY